MPRKKKKTIQDEDIQIKRGHTALTALTSHPVACVYLHPRQVSRKMKSELCLPHSRKGVPTTRTGGLVGVVKGCPHDRAEG